MTAQNQKHASEADGLLRQNLPKSIQGSVNGPMKLARECMELSNKIQHMSQDYMFTTVFMQYIKLRDKALYDEAMLTAEQALKLHDVGSEGGGNSLS